jgi:hypothetical protein
MNSERPNPLSVALVDLLRRRQVSGLRSEIFVGHVGYNPSHDLLEQDPVFGVIPATEEVTMKDKSSQKSGQGIVLDEKAQEQPKDKERAQTVHKSEPGRMPQQPIKKDDELQPLREKSGF